MTIATTTTTNNAPIAAASCYLFLPVTYGPFKIVRLFRPEEHSPASDLMLTFNGE